MKNFLKKSLSMVLVLMLLLGGAVNVLAVGNATETERDIPRVTVGGLMTADIYADPSDPNSEVVWPLSGDAISSAIEKLAGPISSVALSGNWDKFAEEAVPVVDELFDPVCLDYSGEIKNTSGIRFEYPAAEEITKDSHVTFSYDWRLDPLRIAGELNNFIDYVLECSGAEQVTLDCHSYGGVVVLSYFKLFGTEKVRSVMFNATAIYGETYTGELFTGNFVLNDEAVKLYLDYALVGSDADNIVSLLAGAVTDIGVTNFICEYSNEVVDQVYDQFALGVFRMFANWPSIWSMVPDDMLDDATAYVFDDVYTNAGVDYSGLKEKVDNYNNLVRKDKTQTLLDIDKKINLYVIARYGYTGIPITETWDVMSDGIVDTRYNSFGATTAKYDGKLNVSASEYVNPDKNIDASTCLFPEQTWFIKNLRHSEQPSCLGMMIEKLLYHKGQATVDTFNQYPRFMVYDIDYNSLKADTQADYVAFWDRLIQMIMDFFGKFFR